ncbi:MAG TPA: hypothetical protein VJH92_02575 [Candidatus Nanoarchaeia archaeon]|nr:hypothetical protein [Candidatus Nanoarchaeia archaeon]
MSIPSFNHRVHISDDIYQEIIQKVDYDDRQQTVVKHNPEKEETQNPRIE